MDGGTAASAGAGWVGDFCLRPSKAGGLTFLTTRRMSITASGRPQPLSFHRDENEFTDKTLGQELLLRLADLVQRECPCDERTDFAALDIGNQAPEDRVFRVRRPESRSFRGSRQDPSALNCPLHDDQPSCCSHEPETFLSFPVQILFTGVLITNPTPRRLRSWE